MGFLGGGNQSTTVSNTSIADSQNFADSRTLALNNVGNISVNSDQTDNPIVAVIKSLIPVLALSVVALGVVTAMKHR